MTFNLLIKQVIEPTLMSFGFVHKKERNGFIEYEHNVLNISFSYDYNVSFELGVTFTFKINGSFYDYTEMKDCFCISDLIAIQILDESILKKWLEEVEEFLTTHLSEVINNDEYVISKLEKIRENRIKNYENKRKERLINEGVDRFWEQKDYSGLINFLNNYSQVFEGSIKKKYEYAMKMIRKHS